MKQCTICKQYQTLDAFGPHDSAKDGHRNQCKKCRAMKERKRRLLYGDEIRAKQRANYQANSAPALERARVWSINHPEKRREIARNYARRNLDKITSWQKDHPENLREGRRRRQAIRKTRQMGNFAKITPKEWRQILDAAGGRCLYCERIAKLTMDHFIPISLGGATEPRNLVPCCGHCNARKCDNEPHAWISNEFGEESLDRVLAFLNRF